MKNLVLIIFLFTVWNNAFSQFYWGNIDGKDTAVNLTKRIGHDAGTSEVKSLEFGTTDPSVSSTQASQGSIFVGVSKLFQKQDNGSSTNWLPFLLGPIGGGTDNCLARWDGSGAALLQNSIVCISDLGAITGALSLNVGQLALSGSTINSTSGALILSPQVNIPALTASLPLKLDASKNIISQAINLSSSDVSSSLPIANGGTNSGAALANNRVMQSSGGAIVEATAISVSMALVSDLSGIPVASPTSAAELSYSFGVTGPIQTQLNGKEPLLVHGNLTSSTPSLSILGGINAIIGTGTSLSVSSANTTTTGLLTSTDWNTFNNKEPALAKGNLTSSTPSLSILGGTGSIIGAGTSLSVSTANTTTAGIISSTDWNIFNNKEPAITILPLSKGGTNNNITAANGFLAYSDATKLLLTTNISVTNSPAAIAVGSVKLDDSSDQITNTTTNGNLFATTNGTGRIFLQSVGGRPIANRDSTYDYEIGSALLDYSVLSKDPSFERVVTEPSSSSATITQIASTEGHGAFSLQMVSAASTTSAITLDYTTSIATSQQGAVMAGIKTSSSGVQLISRSNGIDVSTQSIPNDGKFYLYEIPVVCGTTSCGYRIIADNDAEVETIEVAYAYAKLGDVKNTSSVVTSWQKYTASFTGFTVSSQDVYWRQNGQNIEVRGKAVFSAASATEARISFPNSFVSEGSSFYPSITNAGDYYIDQGSANVHGGGILIEPSVGYFTMSSKDTFSGTASIALAKAQGSDLGAITVSFKAAAQVSGLSGNASTYSQQGQGTSQIKFYNQATCQPVVTSGSFTTFNHTDCTYAGATKIGSTATPTVAGDLALKVPLVKAGKYRVNYSGNLWSISLGTCYFRLTDGTRIIGPSFAESGGIDSISNLNEIVEYSSDTADVEWKLQARNSAGVGSCRVYAHNTDNGASITLEPVEEKITGSFENVVTTPGVYLPKLFSFKYGGATATTACTGTCTIYEDYGNMVASMINVSTGVYDITWKAGLTRSPNCTASTQNLSVMVIDNNPTSSGWSGYKTKNLNDNVANTHGMVICHGY